MADFEHIRNAFILKIEETEKEVMIDKSMPSTPQEIPEIFRDYTGTARGGLRAALWIARKYNLIPQDSPLRQVWYAFIKLTLEKINAAREAAGQKVVEGKENTFYDALGDIISNSDLWYSDFKILNDPAGFQYPDMYSYAVLFPNIMIALEKESYFGAFKNFCNLLGLTLYAGGGNPSKSASETVAKKVHSLFPNERLGIYTISDYDPMGFQIANTFKEHMKLYLDRYGQDVDSERVAPYPEHYTKEELDRALYTVSAGRLGIWKDEGTRAKITRDAAGIPETLGMEVESLPAELLPSQLPSGMIASEAVGGARMRVILFDKLLEDFHIGNALEKWLNKYFVRNPDAEATSIIDSNSGIDVINKKGWELLNKVEDIQNIIRKELKQDEQELGNEIRDWRDETVEDWINDGSKVDKFEADLRKAVIRNQNQEDFKWSFNKKFPIIPDEFKNWEAPLKIKEKIQEQTEYLDELIAELDERIDNLGSEEDEEDED